MLMSGLFCLLIRFSAASGCALTGGARLPALLSGMLVSLVVLVKADWRWFMGIRAFRRLLAALFSLFFATDASQQNQP